MRAIIVDHPAPACILNRHDPARAWITAENTDIRETFSRNSLHDLHADLERNAAALDAEIGKFNAVIGRGLEFIEGMK